MAKACDDVSVDDDLLPPSTHSLRILNVARFAEKQRKHEEVGIGCCGCLIISVGSRGVAHMLACSPARPRVLLSGSTIQLEATRCARSALVLCIQSASWHSLIHYSRTFVHLVHPAPSAVPRSVAGLVRVWENRASPKAADPRLNPSAKDPAKSDFNFETPDEPPTRAD